MFYLAISNTLGVLVLFYPVIYLQTCVIDGKLHMQWQML